MPNFAIQVVLDSWIEEGLHLLRILKTSKQVCYFRKPKGVARFVGANPAHLRRPAPDPGYDLEELAAGAENFIRLRIGITAARGFSGWKKRPASFAFSAYRRGPGGGSQLDFCRKLGKPTCSLADTRGAVTEPRV